MKFHYLSRALIISNKSILLAKAAGSTNTFLPGGHIELGESAETTLLREIKEELDLNCTINNFVGAVEHIWPKKEKSNQEINLIFQVTIENINSSTQVKSKESHLEFIWVKLDEVEKFNLQPFPLIFTLKDYLNSGKIVWGTTINVV